MFFYGENPKDNARQYWTGSFIDEEAKRYQVNPKIVRQIINNKTYRLVAFAMRITANAPRSYAADAYLRQYDHMARFAATLANPKATAADEASAFNVLVKLSTPRSR